MKVLIAVTAFLVVVWAWKYGPTTFNPPRTAGERVIDKVAGKNMKVKARQAEPGLMKLVEGNDRQLGNALKNFASEDAERLNDWDAALARDRRQVPIIPRHVVYGDTASWVTMAPVFEPMHVTVPPTDTIKPAVGSNVESNADGIYPDGLPRYYRFDQTTLMREWLARRGLTNLTNLELKNQDRVLRQAYLETGRLFELVGRLCMNDRCSDAYPMGTDSVVCPGGYLMARYNARDIVDHVETDLAKNNGVGQYRLTVVPDQFAKLVCSANPGAVIIQTKNLPSQYAMANSQGGK